MFTSCIRHSDLSEHLNYDFVWIFNELSPTHHISLLMWIEQVCAMLVYNGPMLLSQWYYKIQVSSCGHLKKWALISDH